MTDQPSMSEGKVYAYILQNKKLLLDAAAESQPLRKDNSGRVLPLIKAVKQDKLEHASAIEASITGNESPHDIQKRRNIGD
jgi:hypothetical protein